MQTVDKRTLLFITAGLSVGIINGLLGGGGGVIAFLVLTALCKLQVKEAHATSILIILPVSLISAAIYLLNGKVDWSITALASLGVVAGGATGAFLITKLTPLAIDIIYAVILTLSAFRMLTS